MDKEKMKIQDSQSKSRVRGSFLLEIAPSPVMTLCINPSSFSAKAKAESSYLRHDHQITRPFFIKGAAVQPPIVLHIDKPDLS